MLLAARNYKPGVHKHAVETGQYEPPRKATKKKYECPMFQSPNMMFINDYHWVDNSAGGLLVHTGIIHPVVVLGH